MAILIRSNIYVYQYIRLIFFLGGRGGLGFGLQRVGKIIRESIQISP